VERLHDRGGIFSLQYASCDAESPSETIALHSILPEIQNKLYQLNSNDISHLKKGIAAWEKSYYPKKRYCPLVFSNPNDVIDFINGMKVIDIEASDMIATSPKHNGTFYKLNTESSVLEIETKNKSTLFKFNHLSIAKNIPLPLTRSRVINKDRISLSVDKNAKSRIAYQKRLHRLLFFTFYLYGSYI